MPVKIHGISVKTPEELGIQNDPEKVKAYIDFVNHLTGTLDAANMWNNIGIAAGTAGFGYGAAKGADGSGGGSAGGDTSGGDTPTHDNGGNDTQDGSGFDWGNAIKIAGSVAGAVTDFAKKYGTTALEAWNIYNAGQRQAKADQYGQQALDTAKSAYDAKAGLRSSGIAGLMDPNATVPDLSSLKNLAGAGSGNPFARGGALPVAGGRPISGGPIDRTPTPSTPGGSIGSQTLFGGTLPVANTTGAPTPNPGAALQSALPVASTPATPIVKKPTLPTLPFAPTDRTQGLY